jgi:prephenate dehydrogenase
MRTWDTVAIVGVGLIGGSIGLALRERHLARTVVGIGRRKSSLDSALARGCITTVTQSMAVGVKGANLVVVCTPVEQIPAHVAEAAQHCPDRCVITDVGSTKASVVLKSEAALANCYPRHMPFVGSHPIAGSERSGPEAARADLFDNRVVVVTKSEISGDHVVDTIEQFWQSLGARVVRMTPDEHDAALARTSHLPHLVASALSVATPEECLQFAATGWQDTTRIAAGEVELWRQIFLANRGHTLKALTDFETVLSRFRHALESADGSLLAELLAEGKRRRDAMGN